MVHKVIILGSGCAGSSAAIYAARADLAPLVLEGHEPGGQLSLTTDVENYPGFPEGIQGPELVERMKQQAQRFGATYQMEVAKEADLSKRPFKISTDKATYEAQSLIVASGASAILLGLPSESELLGYGVSTCATCDGFFFRDQQIIVVGGGDTAMEEALFLTKFAEKVTVVHRRDELRASKIMADRALKHEKIDFIWDSVVTDILDPQKKSVEAVKLKNVKSGEETTLDVQGVFIGIGHKPNTEIFEGQLDMDQGYLVVHDGARTSVEGVFAAGDVHDRIYQQAVTAAGAGCQAAIDTEKFLEEQEQAESPAQTSTEAGAAHP
jgi:thioredoxin reductase (NADPH)